MTNLTRLDNIIAYSFPFGRTHFGIIKHQFGLVNAIYFIIGTCFSKFYRQAYLRSYYWGLEEIWLNISFDHLKDHPFQINLSAWRAERGADTGIFNNQEDTCECPACTYQISIND